MCLLAKRDRLAQPAHERLIESFVPLSSSTTGPGSRARATRQGPAPSGVCSANRDPLADVPSQLSARARSSLNLTLRKRPLDALDQEWLRALDHGEADPLQQVRSAGAGGVREPSDLGDPVAVLWNIDSWTTRAVSVRVSTFRPPRRRTFVQRTAR